MGFDKEKSADSFSTSIFEPDTIEAKKLIIIACEGENTEPQYFRYIESNFDLKSLVEIEVIKRDDENRTSSAPTKVIESIDTQLDEIKSKYDNFDEVIDLYWIVVDREKDESRKINLLNAKSECENRNIHIALSNPAFEFWLLLHFDDICKYNENDLFENEKVSNKKRFLEQKLTEKLQVYNKSRFDTSFITLSSIELALKQEKSFENELDKIIDHLGSNVGDLIREILDI
jgi:hypothetical protein